MTAQKFYNLSPWNILNDMISYYDRPFGGLFRTLANRVEGRFPPVNCYVGDKAVVLDIEMPGKRPGDVDISLEPQAVVIEGKVEDGAEKQTFKRRFELEFPVDNKKTKATFKNGILRIELPKAAQAVPKRIEIACED
ncbi:MAG: Hsp20/alpha crystallin family protein [Kiritimatiellia bacterium]